jgi:hypothetical protein
MSDTENTKPATTKGTKVRVLSDQGEHKVDDVISLPADEAKAAVAAGWADDHPSAVKYAEGLKKSAPAGDEA